MFSRFFAGAAFPMMLLFLVSDSISQTQFVRKISLCHATGSATNPFILEEIPARAAAAHLERGDIHPVSGECPGGVEGGSVTPTPEPVTMLLFGAGLAGVGYIARRRRRNAE